MNGLAKPQLDWVRGAQCADPALSPVNVNRAYIDVISVDIYRATFASMVRPYYDWLDTHRAKPDQQMALIPGTHYQALAESLGGQCGVHRRARLTCRADR